MFVHSVLPDNMRWIFAEKHLDRCEDCGLVTGPSPFDWVPFSVCQVQLTLQLATGPENVYKLYFGLLTTPTDKRFLYTCVFWPPYLPAQYTPRSTYLRRTP